MSVATAHLEAVTTLKQTLTVFLPNQRAEAEAYAEEIGGFVEDDYTEHGALAVCHEHPEGLAVRLWSSITLPPGTTLQRRDSIRPGDVVVSSHAGRRRVISADLRGSDPAHGTTYLLLEGLATAEAYPGESLIPVVSRGPSGQDIEVEQRPQRHYEYGALRIDTGELVGIGPTERRSSAEEDVTAWRKDGFEVVLRRRIVGEWESVD